MQVPDLIKARLRYGAHGLHQPQQQQDAVSNDSRADLIHPAIDLHNRQTLTPTEHMERVDSLRNHSGELHLRQEDAQVMRDLEATHRGLSREPQGHHAQVADLLKSYEESVQRNLALERFNGSLMSKVNELMLNFRRATIEIANQRKIIESLQYNPAFNVNAGEFDIDGDASPGLIPLGKSMVETMHGDTASIRSSPISIPEKAGTNHGRTFQRPSGSTAPFSGIVPQSASLTPAHRVPTQVTIRKPDRPRGRAIVKGTSAANESFARMQHNLNPQSPTTSVMTSNIDSNTTVVSSSSASDVAVSNIRPLAVPPVTPSKFKSKLNPAVEAFTPSDSSSKESAKSNSLQAISPSTDESKASTTANKEEGFIPVHLRRPSKLSIKEGPSSTTEKLSHKTKDYSTAAMSIQKGSTKEAEPCQSIFPTPPKLPHLRRPTELIKNEEFHLFQKGIEGHGLLLPGSRLTSMKENGKGVTTLDTSVKSDPGLEAWLNCQEKAQSNITPSNEAASTYSDNLIDFSPDSSPKVGTNKTVPLPPGFIPAKNSSMKNGNPMNKNQDPTPWQDVSVKTASETETNAAFIAQYSKNVNSVSEKYGKHSGKSLYVQEDNHNPAKPKGCDLSYNFSKPNGMHGLGALLDAECYKMVVKPRKAVTSVEAMGLEHWKMVRKDGKVFYVL